MADLSLAERAELADDLTAFTYVLLLDQVWSSAAEPEQLAPTDDDALHDVVERLHAAVDEAVRKADRLAEIIYGHREALSEQIGQVLERIEQPDRRSVEDVLEAHAGSIAEVARRSSDLLAHEAPAAQAGIDEQLDALLRGETASGDLPPRFLCGMAKCMMAGGMVATWVPPHIQGPAVIGAAVTVYKAVGCRG